MTPLNAPEHSVGWWIGRSLPIVLAGLGLLWCGLILKRPAVNRKGILALALVLIAWILAMLGPGNVAAPAGIAVTVAALGCLVGSAVLAVVGLVELNDPQKKFSGGRGQAIAALVLAGVSGLGLMSVALTGALIKSREARRSREREAGTGQPVELQAERFRLKTLPAPWVKMDPKKLNQLACLGFARSRPEMYCIVIVEFVGPDQEVDLDLYVAAVKSNLLRGDPLAKVEEEKPESLNGTPGVRMTAKARVNNIDIFYRYWMHSGPGRAYQVILWGPDRDRARILAESEPLMSNIEILSPKE